MSRARRVARGIGLGLAALAVLALLLAGLLYLNRRAAAREMLTGWLEKRGVPSEVEIERVELDGLVARVRAGDPRDPDFAVERVEVDYVIGAPWSARGLGVTPSRVRLGRPGLKARWPRSSKNPPAARPAPTAARPWCWSRGGVSVWTRIMGGWRRRRTPASTTEN